MKKIITIFVIIIFVCCINVSVVKAAKGWSTQNENWWVPTTDEEDVGSEEIQRKANIITTAIRNIGIVIAILVLMIIGIKEMFASSEEKSKFKELIPGYLLGVFMVVAVSLLPTLIFNIMKQIK